MAITKVNTIENQEKKVKDAKVSKENRKEENDVKTKDVANKEPPRKDHPRMSEMRDKVLEYVKENEGVFHPDDVELLKTNNLWINRFLHFCGQSFEKAFEHLIDTFKYRKEFGIRSIDKSIFPIECWLSSTAFLYLPDREGRPTLYVRVKNHLRGEEKVNKLFRQFLIVLIDELDKLANKENGYNVVLDLCDMGWKNLDLDMLQFLIETSRYRYPQGLKYCFVHGLPWFLNIVIKKIVSTLPSDTSKKVRFVNGSNYKELSLEKVTSNFVKSTDLNNNDGTKIIETIEKKREKLEMEEYYDINNLPSHIGGKATLNHRIMPRTAMSSLEKVGTVILKCTEEETDRMIKPFKNVINDARQAYNTLKERNLEFEFELDELSNALVRHIRR